MNRGARWLICTSVILAFMLSGCLGLDFRPPEHERDDVGYVVKADEVTGDQLEYPGDPVYRFDDFGLEERDILNSAIRDEEYLECDNESGVSVAVKNLTSTFRDGRGYVKRNGTYYDMHGGAWTHMC